MTAFRLYLKSGRRRPFHGRTGALKLRNMPLAKRREETPFQMAPMIDMVFLLLVFFMTVSTLARDARPELSLPDSSTAKVPTEVPPREVITVERIAPDEGNIRYHLGGRILSTSQLRDHLENLPDPGSRTLLLRGPEDLPYRAWEEVVRWCRAFGFTELLFATFEE